MCARLDARVDGKRSFGRVVQEKHQVRNEAMPTRQVDDAPSAKPTTRAPRHFPRLEELLPRKARELADHTCNSIEKGVTVEMMRRRRLETHTTSRMKRHCARNVHRLSALDMLAAGRHLP